MCTQELSEDQASNHSKAENSDYPAQMLLNHGIVTNCENKPDDFGSRQYPDHGQWVLGQIDEFFKQKSTSIIVQFNNTDGEIFWTDKENRPYPEKFIKSWLLIDRPVHTFQERVKLWLDTCFGRTHIQNHTETADRFLEEVCELLQSLHYPKERFISLVFETYQKKSGFPHQELGGVMTTLAALSLSEGLDMYKAGEDELARIWKNAEEIARKSLKKKRNL